MGKIISLTIFQESTKKGKMSVPENCNKKLKLQQSIGELPLPGE